MIYIFLLLIGIVAAAFGSLVGLGGGIIIVPSLIFLEPILLHQGITTSIAVGTSLFVLIITALSSSLTYIKEKRVDFRTAWLFFITSGPGAILGALLTNTLNPNQFQLWFGFLMLVIATMMVVKPYMKPININWKFQTTYTDPQGVSSTYGYHFIPILVMGLMVGLVSGLFGIGGGSLFVPLMVLLFAFPAHVATATSMFVIFLSSITGSVTHIWAGDISWFSVMLLAPGAWIGGKLGAKLALRLSSEKLLWILRSTLLILAFRMIWEGLA